MIDSAWCQPAWEWATSAGGEGKDGGYAVKIDSQGDVYVLGIFRDFDIAFGSNTLINAGGDDIFIAKYNSLGSLIWVNNYGNSGTDIPCCLLIDKNDDVYFSGSFDSPSLTFGANTLINPSPGSYDSFSVKLNSSGQILWAKNSSNSNLGSGVVAIDDNLNMYNVDYTSTTATLYKYSSNETLIWSKTITTTGGISTVDINDIALDDTSVYITGGFFGSSMTIETTTLINNTPANSEDMYIAKLDPSGNLQWSKNAVDKSSDWGRDIELDNSGNIFLLGQYCGDSIVFDNKTIYTNGGCDLFITKFNESGQTVWAKGTGSSENDWVGKLALDVSGGPHIIGQFYGPDITFANNTHNNAGVIWQVSDAFVLKYNNNGHEIWMKAIQAFGDDDGHGIDVNALGEVYVTGAIGDTVGGITTFGGHNINSYGYDDMFLAKIGSNLSVNPFTSGSTVLFCPNPINDILNIKNLSEFMNGKMEVYDIMGKLRSSQKIDKDIVSFNMSNFASGVYFVKVTKGNNSVVQKVVR